jgi:hypothetical protein
MKFHPCLFPLFLLLLLFPSRTSGQYLPNPKDSLVRALVSEGFENVGIYSAKKDVFLFFENRRYRWEVDGLAKILDKATAAFNDSTVIHLVPLHHKVPVTVVTTVVSAYKARQKEFSRSNFTNNPIHAVLNTDSVYSIQKKVQLQNSTFGKIDLLFLPGLRLQYGNFDQPIEWMVSISPILQASLWRGSLLSAQVFIPLHNELQYQYESKPRIETATINQLFRLPKNVFIYSSAGIFAFTNHIGLNIYLQRIGATCDIRKYFCNGRVGAGVTAGYTGLVNLSNGYFNYDPEQTRMNFAFFGEYREPKFDFTTRLSAGKFLYNDYAVKLEISRQFHEMNLSFYVIKSELKSPGENGTVGGISISIPIAPKKTTKPAPFRVNLAKYFNFEYIQRIVDPIGRSYRTNPDWNDTFRNLNPDFVEKHL